MPENRDDKCLQKAWHSFLIYSPVIMVLSFIVIIYTTYIVGYIAVLMSQQNSLLNDKIYPYLTKVTDHSESSYIQGLVLLIVTLYFLTFFMIAFLRTVAMDPGFFNAPTEFERNIILKQNEIDPSNEKAKMLKQNTFNYLTNFSKQSEIGPLNEKEEVAYRQQVEENLMTISDEIMKNPVERDSCITVGSTNKKIDEQVLETDGIIKKPEATDMEDIWENFKKVNVISAPLCSSCHRFKYERSHHCRQCGRCVLKMDHHCPWLANCVGFRNYKYFCLTHFYGVILTSIIALSLWEAVAGALMSMNSVFMECFIFVLAYILNLGLMGFLIWLLAVNTRLVFTGQTVIEQSDRERFPSAKAENIYDLGKYKNFTNVFGTNPLLWFFPFGANYKGEGLVYEKKEGKGNEMAGNIHTQ